MTAPASSPLAVIVPATLEVPAVPDILEEHLEELGYLWLQRRRLSFSTQVPARRLPEIDERIAAHGAGLRLGGARSVAAALERFEDSNPWIVAAAVFVWLSLGRPDRAQVVERLTDIPEPAWASWREAMRRLVVARLSELAPAEDVAAQPMPLRMLLVDAYAWHGGLPAGVAVREARQGPPAVKAAVARHLGGMPKDPMWTALASELGAHEVPEVARGALWSLGLLERKTALAALRAHISGPPAALDPARLLLCGVFGEREDAATLLALGGEIEVVAAATRAVGELGGREQIGLLLPRLGGTPEVATAAAAALERLVGPLQTLVPSLQEEAADLPPSFDGTAVAAEVEARTTRLPAAAMWLDGRPYPYAGPAGEEPLAWQWRGNVRGERADAAWLRREIPDGLLAGEWAEDARVGE